MRLIRLFRDALLAAPDGRLLQRSLLNFLLGLGGSMLLVGAALGVLALAGIPFDEIEAPGHAIGMRDVIVMVILAPLIETPLLIALLALLPARMGIVPRAAVSALAWGGVHARRAVLVLRGGLGVLRFQLRLPGVASRILPPRIRSSGAAACAPEPRRLRFAAHSLVRAATRLQ